MDLANMNPVDPDEDYNTEEEDFDITENDQHEIEVDDDINEPDVEAIDLGVEPIPNHDDEEDD
jgi:hypothetical protein